MAGDIAPCRSGSIRQPHQVPSNRTAGELARYKKLMTFFEYHNPLWDCLTAVGTIAMAVTTFVVVLQGRRQRKDDQQRHQDTFRPVCVLSPYDGVDPQYQRNTLVTATGPDSSRPDFGTIEIRCAVKNIGSGPALNLRIMLRFHDLGGYTTDPSELSPLAAGEFRGTEEAPLRIALHIHAPLQSHTFAELPSRPWDLILVYEDVFGSVFHTIHAKNPLQMNKLSPVEGTTSFMAPSQPWAVPGKGKPPTFSGQGLITGFTPQNSESKLGRLFRMIRFAGKS